MKYDGKRGLFDSVWGGSVRGVFLFVRDIDRLFILAVFLIRFAGEGRTDVISRFLLIRAEENFVTAFPHLSSIFRDSLEVLFC